MSPTDALTDSAKDSTSVSLVKSQAKPTADPCQKTDFIVEQSHVNNIVARLKMQIARQKITIYSGFITTQKDLE